MNTPEEFVDKLHYKVTLPVGMTVGQALKEIAAAAGIGPGDIEAIADAQCREELKRDRRL